MSGRHLKHALHCLSDTGCGMSAETLEQAFEPFFTTRPEGQGGGPGLSMAYGFVEQSGGDMRIHSEPEAGDQQAANAAPVGGSETILVVEDDRAVQATAVEILRELGYRVLYADNGKRVLDIVKNGAAVDLLFADVAMPGSVHRIDLVRYAKALLPGIAILFLSGYM